MSCAAIEVCHRVGRNIHTKEALPRDSLRTQYSVVTLLDISERAYNCERIGRGKAWHYCQVAPRAYLLEISAVCVDMSETGHIIRVLLQKPPKKVLQRRYIIDYCVNNDGQGPVMYILRAVYSVPTFR